MSENLDGSSSHLKRLTILSKSVSDAINEIFSMAYAQAQVPGPEFPPEGEPDVRLADTILWINRVMIPLASRQKTLLLLQAFFASKSLTLTKAEIVSAVYGVKDDCSARYVEAQDINLTKLLSRTRTFLEESLEYSYQTQPLDWLVFDIKTRRYCLYRLRKDYVKPQ